MLREVPCADTSQEAITRDVLRWFYPRQHPLGEVPDATEDSRNASSSTSSEATTVTVSENDGATHGETKEADPLSDLAFLSTSSDARSGASSGRIAASDDVDEHTALWHLVILILRISIPVAVTMSLRTAASLVTVVFLGNYLEDTTAFAAASTGVAFLNLTAMSVGAGWCSALDTLGTQAHGRRRNNPTIALVCWRSVCCTFATYLPIAIFFAFFSRPVLRVIVHEDLVDYLFFFLRYSFFIATPMLLVNNLLKFAQSQRVTGIGVISSAVGLVTLPPLLFLFKNWEGLAGVVLAMSLNRLLTLTAVLVGIWRNEGLMWCMTQSVVEYGGNIRTYMSNIFLHKDEWVVFFKVGVPNLAANCADSWCFEVIAILAAHVGPLTAAVWTVIFSLYSPLFSYFVGLASASAIRIGNALGMGRGLLARKYLTAALAVGCASAVVCSCLLWFFAPSLYPRVQKNEEVTRRGEKVVFLTGVCFFLDSTFYYLQGPFRAANKTELNFMLIILCMWGITVPLAFIFCLQLNLDARGILLALCCGLATAVPLQVLYLYLGVPWEALGRAVASQHH